VAGAEDNAPRFVVHATALLEAGRNAEAVVACRAGIQRYPWYATGYWVLGKCYEALGDLSDAHAQYLEVARRLHGIPSINDALERTRPVMNAKAAVAEPAGDDMDLLLRKLQDAGRITPSSDPDVPFVDMATPQGEEPIATVTLAEIYAAQGRYKEALEAYRRITQQRPDDAGRHDERMAELEQLLQRTDKFRQP